MEGYITVTYLKDWKSHSLMLGDRGSARTAQRTNIAERVKHILNSFGLLQRVSCIVTDNAAVMLKAVREDLKSSG